MAYLVHHGVKGMKWGVRHDDDMKAASGSNDYRETNKWVFRTIDKDIDDIKSNGAKVGTKKQAIEKQKEQLQRELDRIEYRSGSKEVLDIAKKHGVSTESFFSNRDSTKFSTIEKRTSKDAEKDAKEFARAKAFYGEGAGNRRKAIKTTVESKSKKDDFYALEFEYHLSNQDMQEHMSKANAERKRKDANNSIKKGLRYASKLL